MALLLMTYLPKFPESQVFDKKYDKLKEVLGISISEPLYFCYPANNVYQAVLNSYSAEPIDPYTLHFFLTNDAYAIDLIKWQRLVEEQTEDCVTADITNISYNDAVMYITTKLPTNNYTIHFTECRKSSYIKNLDKQANILFQKHTGSPYMSISSSRTYSFFKKLIEDYNDETDESEENIKGVPVKYYKLVFEASLFVILYEVARMDLTWKALYSISITIPEQPIIIRLMDQYIIEYSSLLSVLSDDEAHDRLQMLRKDFEKAVLMSTVTYPNTSPNDLCPCGSGKKYKKCCKGLSKSPTDMHLALTESQPDENIKYPDKVALRPPYVPLANFLKL